MLQIVLNEVFYSVIIWREISESSFVYLYFNQGQTLPVYESQLCPSPFLQLAVDGQPALFQRTLHSSFYHYCQTLWLKFEVICSKLNSSCHPFSAIFVLMLSSRAIIAKERTLYDCYITYKSPLRLKISRAHCCSLETKYGGLTGKKQKVEKCLHQTR